MQAARQTIVMRIAHLTIADKAIEKRLRCRIEQFLYNTVKYRIAV
jgi:hypothetical protein